MPNDTPTQYEEGGRSIAFVDILGFANHIQRSETPEHFQRIWTALHAVRNVSQGWPTSAVQEGIPAEHTEQALDFRSHTFSDSIVLSERGRMVAPLIFAVARLTMDLLRERVLVRGGIAVGKLHHDESVVFGPALVDAYRLEETAAKYPRVLMSDEALAIASENSIQFGGYALKHRASSFIAQDADGLHFVDVLKVARAAPEAVAGVPLRRLSSQIIAAREWADQQREEERTSQYVRANFGWVVHYIDGFLAANNDLDVTIG